MVKKALLVGINYFNTDSELLGCGNDVQNIRDMLIKFYNYEAKNITVLSEKPNVTIPTRSAIETGITQLAANCKSGDTLVLYYSGHGAYVNDTNGDETDGKDEVIVPLDYIQRGVITDDWLYSNLIKKIPQGANLWVFMDCCHSGTMIDLKYNYKSRCVYKKNGQPKGVPYNGNDWSTQFLLSLEQQNEVVGNICCISGCQDEQTSADAQGLGSQNQGAFSYCLLETIRVNKAQNIKLGELLKEINCRLILNNFEQISQLSVSRQGDIVNRNFEL